jgi:ribosome biogenesis GTPase
VGKSTLINALTGDARLATQEVRASDSRGRHTTRHRQLIALPGECGLLIDTPGMRELQVWDATGAIVEAFDDIESLAADCHFRDCRHRDEPRCAVRQAVAEGRLDEGRWTSYLKLQDERDAIERRKDVRARIEEKRTGKVIGRAIKAMYRLKGRS